MPVKYNKTFFVFESFWFTCDKRREMKSFLDGKMHVRYGEKGAEEKTGTANQAFEL